MKNLKVLVSHLDGVVAIACTEYCRTRNIEPINALLRGAMGETKERLIDFFVTVIAHHYDNGSQQFYGEPRVIVDEQSNMLDFYHECGGLFSQWVVKNYDGGDRLSESVALLMA